MPTVLQSSVRTRSISTVEPSLFIGGRPLSPSNGLVYAMHVAMQQPPHSVDLFEWSCGRDESSLDYSNPEDLP